MRVQGRSVSTDSNGGKRCSRNAHKLLGTITAFVQRVSVHPLSMLWGVPVLPILLKEYQKTPQAHDQYMFSRQLAHLVCRSTRMS